MIRLKYLVELENGLAHLTGRVGLIQIATPDILSKLAKQENIMEALKPGTLCVIVGGCPENIGLVVEVLEHIGVEPPRADAYRIRTTSGRNFPQLKFGRKEKRLAAGTSTEAITDRHKLRPLVDASDDETDEHANVAKPAEDGVRIANPEHDPAGTPQEKDFVAGQRQMFNRFVQASSEGKSLAEMDADVALWWWNRY
jgi:hypothetical protein